MNAYENANVTGDLRRAFETSIKIYSGMQDSKIRSAYLMLGLLVLGDTIINKFFYEYSYPEKSVLLYPDEALKGIMVEPDTFKQIFGEKACKEFFEEDEEDIEEDTTEEEKETAEEQEEKYDIVELIRAETKKAIKDQQLEDEANRMIEEFIPDLTILYSDKLEDALNDAAMRCKAVSNVIDVDNVIYSLLNKKDSSAYKLIEMFLTVLEGATMEDLIRYIELNANIYTADLSNFVSIPKSLESCCENFNKKFVKGEKSEILGRDKEKQQLWNIFSKKTKSNAILIGEPGVGKTAIIEAITQDIVNEECPKRFLGYTVISFDVGAAVAGTKYRGEFEEKVNMLKKFIEKTPKVILFIDEIHMTLGAGSTTGDANDLSGSLKSTLARDDVIVVGTTTNEEYNRFINSDGAFKRRFETVKIKEPKYNEVKAMVSRKIEGLEKFHSVKLKEGLLEYMITASSCFNSNSSNPDRTLDLADRTMSVAENLGDSIVTKEHIKKVFKEAYEKLYSVDEKVKEVTAYHESAHYVVSRVSEYSKELQMIAVSIVPFNDFLGVNIPELKEDISLRDKDAFMDHICMRLAGRVIEQIRYNQIDIGASSDLEHATILAKYLITLYGMDEFWGNLSCGTDNNPILERSEEYMNQVNEKIRTILQEATKKTEKMLTDNMLFVEMVAEALLEKSLLTKEDLDALYDEYMISKKSE